MNDFDVDLIDDSVFDFNLIFHGPVGSFYEGGVWKLHVQLPVDYPYKPPIVTFINKIFHPNIDENSGAICLDVMDKLWSPMSDIVKVFEIILPQLLLDPNPDHGLNHEAIFLLMTDKQEYEDKVKEYRDLYAIENDVPVVSEDEDEPSDDDSDDAVVGHLEL